MSVLFTAVLMLAAVSSQGTPRTDTIRTFSGSCEKASMLTHEFTRTCEPTLIYGTSTSGRVTVAFPVASGSISFAGNLPQNDEDGMWRSFSVDRVVMVTGGQADSLDATGRCVVGNLRTVERTIHCRGLVGEDVFEFIFRTDGKAAQVEIQTR